jgi:N-acetylglucosamine transport system substrate-binding protein
MSHSPHSGPYPTRRTLLRTAVTAGLAAPLLSACVTSGSDDPTAATDTAAKTADNPLGVKDDAALEVVIFKGGYGDEYAKSAENRYTQRFPKAKVDH